MGRGQQLDAPLELRIDGEGGGALTAEVVAAGGRVEGIGTRGMGEGGGRGEGGVVEVEEVGGASGVAKGDFRHLLSHKKQFTLRKLLPAIFLF